MAPVTATATFAKTRPHAAGRLFPCALAALLGLALLYGVALAPQPAVHAAAHDARHAAGIPCH